MTFQTSIAASLPSLEITGEHIPAPKNWKDECAEIIVQNEYDVETPYMVESWLKGKWQFILMGLTIFFDRDSCEINFGWYRYKDFRWA